MEAIDCDIDCDISFKDHTLTMQDLESGLETTITDNDESKDIFRPPSLLLETYYDYAKTEAYSSFESTAPVILSVETVKEGEDTCEEEICTVAEERLEMTTVKCQNCKSGFPPKEFASHQDQCSSTVSPAAITLSNPPSEPSEIENYDDINTNIAFNASLQNITRTYKRTPANHLLPVASSTPNALPSSARLTKNQPGEQLDESLSVSASNSVDSLKVKVQYERKFSCISRKKCSGVSLKGVHPERMDNTEVRLRSVASTNQSLEQSDKYNPANQMAYYQKLLEIRSRTGNNNKLSITITADDNHCETPDTVNIEDTNDDCVLLEDTTYSCSVCSYTTDKQKNLNDHERNHRRNNKEIFNCVYCNQKYTKHALYLHVQNIHPGQKFYISQQYSTEKESLQIKPAAKVNPTKILKVHHCKLCSYSTRNKNDLMSHQKLHACGMPLEQCDLCEFRSTSRALLAHKIKHKASVNQLVDSGPPALHLAEGEGEGEGEKIYKNVRNTHYCPKCSYNSNDLGKVRSHQRVHLMNTPIIQCQYCDFRSTSSALAAHKKKIHGNELGLDKSSYSASRDDSRIVSTEEAHEYIRGDEIPALIPMDETERKEKPKPVSKCDKCAFIGQSIADLRRHVKSSHSATDLRPSRNTNGRFSCEECSYESMFSSDVARHKVSHKTQPMLQCLTCDYKSTPRPLSLHVKICPRKNLRANLSSSVADSPPEIEDYSDVLHKPAVQKPETNLLRSGDDPPPEIEDCSSGPRKPAGFKTKAKLFKCSQCTYSSSLRIKLNTHVKNKHPRQKTPESQENSQKCPHCDYTNRNSHQLEQHVKGHRSNMPTFKCGSCEFAGNTFALRRHYLKSGHSLEKKQLVSNCSTWESPQKQERKEVQGGQLAPSLSDSPPQLEPMHVSPTQVYRCSQCSFNGPNFHNFEKHVKSHTNQPVLECRCGYRANRSCLRRHSKNCPLKDRRASRDTERIRNPPLIIQKEVDEEPKKPVRTSARLSKQRLQSEGKQLNSREGAYENTSRSRTLGADNSAKQNLWKCAECSYTAKRKVDGIHHMKSHQNNIPIKSCPNCPFKSTNSQIRIHIFQKHGSVKSDDKHSFGSGPSLTQSERKRPSRRSRYIQDKEVCPHCDFKSGKAEALRKHLLIHETLYGQSANEDVVQEQAKPTPSIQCTLCSAKFLTSSGLSSHIRSHSRNHVLSKCPSCAFKSTSLALRRHIGEEGHDSEKKHEFKCHICVAGFSTAVRLNQHLTEHKRNEKLRESAKAKSPKNMKNQAAASVSPERKNSDGQAEFSDFQCDKCPYSTPLRIKLNVHKRKRHFKKTDGESSNKSHTSKKPKLSREVLSPSNSRFNCSLCDYLATGRETLKRHESSHLSNDHPIMQCVYCKFKGTSNMFCTHQNTCPKRTDESEPFKTPQKVALSCSRCSFTTYRPSDLKNHSENCTVEVKVIKDMKSVKMFKCNYCSFTSFWQYLIDRHKQSHEVLKLPIQQCPKCRFKSTPTALSAHLKECHPGFNA
ncbi:zinc finger protein 91-like [Euwallacea fornicatus]|uniref:zinc finger protein 91-like n=1 Tax=Euwallacea fornicatus TaxID=995702 RepID=UPI00338F78FC